MAGGKSSRMGTDKGLMTFQGKRLVEYAIELLQPFCSEIIISTNQAGYEGFGFKTVSDVYRDCGPVGGLHAALSESNYDYNLIVSCRITSYNVCYTKLLRKTKAETSISNRLFVSAEVSR